MVRTILKYFLTLVIGIVLGVIPIYIISEKALLSTKFVYAVALSEIYARHTSGNQERIGGVLKRYTDYALHDLNSHFEIPWNLECTQTNLMDESLVIKYYEQANGTVLQKFCPNELDEKFK